MVLVATELYPSAQVIAVQLGLHRYSIGERRHFSGAGNVKNSERFPGAHAQTSSPCAVF